MARRYVGGSSPAISSLDITLDIKEIASFYSQLKDAYGKFVAASSLIGLFVDSKGNGLLTAGGARAGKALFLNVIDQKKKITGTNWPALSKEQKAMHDTQAGYGLHWKFKGHVYRNIIARKVGKGWEIGLRKNKMVRVTRFSGKSTGTVPIMKYASAVEYGTRTMEARPLFLPVSVHYNRHLGKALKLVVKESIKRLIKDYTVGKDVGKFVTRTGGGGISQASLDAANPNGEFDSTITSHNLNSAEFANAGINITKFVGPAGLNQIVRNKKQTFKEIENGIRKVAGSHKLINDADQWLADNKDLLEGYE